MVLIISAETLDTSVPDLADDGRTTRDCEDTVCIEKE
jgi:hypothetical protein